jgi:hypothetical protein
VRRAGADIRAAAVVAAIALLTAPAGSRQQGTINVSFGGDLQAAIDRAQPGDRILLAPGARFSGSFVLPARPPGGGFITIGTNGPGLPGAGVRTGPRWSGLLAVIASDTGKPALRTAPGAHHWRIENVEFGPTAGGAGAIVELGLPPPGQRSLAEVPHNLVLDRVYIHGDPATGQRRGVALNSAATEVINSHIGDIKATGFDTQAIGGWNGPGPYLIENNYLEAAGENIMFGGGDPSIDGLVPSGIIIRRNHITRPLSWRGAGWTVKNLLELKNARDVTIEENTLEHHWAGAQSGYAIVFTPRNQEGRAPWSVVEDVRFTGNLVRHVSAGINISGTDDERPSGRARGISILRNRFEDISGAAWGGPGDFIQIGNGPEDVRVEGNTVDQTGRIISAYGNTHRGLAVANFVFRDNIVRHNRYGVIGSDASPGRVTLERFFPGAVFEGNVITGGDPGQYPKGNRFVTADEFRRLMPAGPAPAR